MKRQKFTARTIYLIGPVQLKTALALLPNLPLDPDHPLEIVIREKVKKRKLDQQALLFAGPMRDISEQAWLDKRQFSVEVWHTWCKQKFLPEDFDPELCLEGYRKWDIDPEECRILIGSTTQLTVKGYSQYLEQVFAFGSSLGVEFHTKESQFA
jgi:hypothetical protein